MHHFRKVVLSFFVAALVTFPVQTNGQQDGDNDRPVRHVLLISVDGLHALDLTTYVAAHPNSTLAQLSQHGITYTNNSTSQPSDSFPGLASLVTGGSPVTVGLWYDDTYNRKLSPPRQTDGLGDPGGNCPGQVGTIVAWDESIDINLEDLDGGGGINPNFLVRDPNNNCATIMPHQYLRVNTIFEVVKANGGYTAWTDKHPSYEWANGPSGQGVDDFYGPEINSIPVALPQFPGCSPVPFKDNGKDDGWTTDLRNIQCYDSLHVKAVLNQIDGYTHDRSRKAPVPAIFGTNFQAVSVGEKLAGQLDTPTSWELPRRGSKASSTSSMSRSGNSSPNSRIKATMIQRSSSSPPSTASHQSTSRSSTQLAAPSLARSSTRPTQQPTPSISPMTAR